MTTSSLIDLKAAYLTLETFAYTKGAGGDVWDALRNMSKAAAMGEAKPEKHDPRAPMMALASPASDCQSEISNNSDWQKIDDVLHEASRLIDYFANGKTLFVGSGTPVGCLERINHALNLVAAMRKPEPVMSEVAIDALRAIATGKRNGKYYESYDSLKGVALHALKELGMSDVS